MNRFHIKDLKQWYDKSIRMPLIIRGARQVGKSTLVRLFCEGEGLDLIEINLERGHLRSIEKDDISVQEVLDEIQLKTKKKIQKNSVIFLDEIQEQPKLLKFLRYFYEERPDIAVISAGSLLEIILNDENFSFPVGRVEFFYLGPMTYIEFLYATGNEYLAEKIEKLEFSESVYSLAQKEFRNYMYVGGMPQAVKTYAKEKSLVFVREVQEQILQTYIADFPKYNKKIKFDRIQRIFQAAASQIGKKLIYQKLDDQSQSRDIRRVVDLLIDARVILSCIHSNGNTVPLGGESDFLIKKLFFLDIGLVNCLLKIDLDTIDIEFKNSFNTKGMLAEQFVAQHLAYIDGPSIYPTLYYWLRDKGSQKGEIDFLIERNQNIIPLEVKSTAAGHMKSLFYFIKEKNKNIGLRLSLNTYSRSMVEHKIDGQNINFELISLPIWAVESLYKALDQK